MQTWIFQANPRQFNLDGFLSTKPQSMLWLAKQRAADMRIGDQVFLWRAIGGGPAAESGILAETAISSLATVRSEDSTATPFWTAPEQAAPALRVELQLKRIELKRRFKRDWLDNDPVLAKTPLLTLRTGTNFLLKTAEADRLNALWRRALVPWTYAEVVAALWAYAKVSNGPMSRLPGEPISDVALVTGRVVQGVYNKLMNLRSLDPTDSRQGFSQTSQVDKRVWDRFFDSALGALRVDEIDAEYRRLWPDAVPILPPEVTAEEQARTLASLSLAELLARYAVGAAKRPARPRAYRTITPTFEREPLIVAIARVRAAGVCEVPSCHHPIFRTTEGVPFLEVHHIEPLSEGGSDTPDNVAAVCPSHHREAHHGAARAVIKTTLAALRKTSSDATTAP